MFKVLVSILLYYSMIFSATYYVSTGGSNSKSGSSISSSWCNINYAVNKVSGGDTVLVADGVYNERVTFNTSGSSKDGYIVLKNISGKTPVIDGAGFSGNGLVTIDANYIKIIGFEIRNLKGGDTPMGISVEGTSNHIEIRKNKIHNIESNSNAHGLAVYGEKSSSINNLVIDSNEIYDCKLGQSESMVLNGNVENWVVSNNIVHDNDNIGIDFIGFENTGPSGKDQARDGVCVGNHIYNISSGSNPTYSGDKCAGGIYVDGGKDIIIERNIVDNCDIGIEIASEHNNLATSNITVRNNFISRGYQGNILVGGYDSKRGDATNIKIINNTMYKGSDGEIVLQYNCDGIDIINNILFAKSGKTYVAEVGGNNKNVTLNNNIYYGASTSSSGDWSDANGIFSNPELKSPTSDLRVESSSPAVDAGADLSDSIVGTEDIDGNSRVSGSAIDVGAYEYSTGPHILSDVKSQSVNGLSVSVFPNPFSLKTAINISSSVSDNFTVDIYDLHGKIIKSFGKCENASSISWDGKDNHSKILPNGVYFLSISDRSKSNLIKLFMLH